MAGEEPVAAGSGASGTTTTVSDKGSDGPNKGDGAGTRVRAPPQHDAVQAVVGVALIMLGCGANNFFLELIVSPSRNADADPAAGPLLTFLQFAAVAVLSGISRLRVAPGGWLPSMPRRRIPLSSYWLLVVMFMVMSMLNNYAFALHISQPLHMVFRSAGLVASFLVGKLVFSKEYTLAQFAAVVMLSLGALLATAAEALVGDTAAAAATATCASCDAKTAAGVSPPSPRDLLEASASGSGTGVGANDDTVDPFSTYMLTWYLGLLTLTATLILSAVMGQYQDSLRKYGGGFREMMFYQHLLALPIFVISASSMAEHAQLWSTSQPAAPALAQLFGLSPASVASALGPVADVPVMWVYVGANVLCQYVCVRGVFVLNQAAGALTLQLALTVRKFLSLFLSIWFFGNTFTRYHWTGASLAFAAILVYNVFKRTPATGKEADSSAKKTQ